MLTYLSVNKQLSNQKNLIQISEASVCKTYTKSMKIAIDK